MRPPLKQRIKQWICTMFRHRPEAPDKYFHVWCKRCGHLVKPEADQ